MYYTPKQLEVIRFVSEYQGQREMAPTLEEIADRFGVSKITVLEHLRALERKGAIRRDRYRARAIEILDPNFRPGASEHEIMLLGRIAAGRPIEVVEDPQPMDLSELTHGSPDRYLLRVQGESMIEDAIADGDYIVVEKRASARNGEVVVAMVDGEATLKRYYLEGTAVRLQPANSAMQPIFVRPDHLEVRGVVVGVIRKF